MSDVAPESAPESDSGSFGVLPRPPGQLRSLSMSHRWEVTRRHPYYLTFWTSARRFHHREPLESEVDGYLRQAAVAILGAIGVAGPPFDPADEFSQIVQSTLGANRLVGTIHPVSCRGLIGMLIAALPEETLAGIGAFLTNHFSPQSSRDDQRMEALLEWSRYADAHVDQYVDEPILSISPSASIRSLERDLPKALEPWRTQPGLIEHRQRAACFEDCLRVWDLREGWISGGYDNSTERRLRDVASELGLPLSTANNRYRNAFELITGYPYSPAAWYRFFSGVKLSSAVADVIGAIAVRRPSRSPSRRPIPESVVTPPGNTAGLVESSASNAADQDVADLILDIQELFQQGLSNSEIAARFGISSDLESAIEELRARFQDE